MFLPHPPDHRHIGGPVMDADHRDVCREAIPALAAASGRHRTEQSREAPGPAGSRKWILVLQGRAGTPFRLDHARPSAHPPGRGLRRTVATTGTRTPCSIAASQTKAISHPIAS